MLDNPIFASQRAAAFLLTDLDLAMTFLDLAAASRNPETSQRNHKNARKAYDTVLRFSSRLTLTGPPWEFVWPIVD